MIFTLIFWHDSLSTKSRLPNIINVAKIVPTSLIGESLKFVDNRGSLKFVDNRSNPNVHREFHADKISCSILSDDNYVLCVYMVTFNIQFFYDYFINGGDPLMLYQ